MILVTGRLQAAFYRAYNATRTREEFPEGGPERIVRALDAVLAELQAEMEAVRLTDEERAFIERMYSRGAGASRADHAFAGSLAVIMSRLGREDRTSEIPPEGKHRS